MERTLGHARYLSGDLPGAIAAYRRGLHLAPGDERLTTALAYARSRVEYPPSPVLAAQMRPAEEVWPARLSLRHFGWYALAAYAVACLTATRSRMTRRRRWAALAVVLAVLVLVPTVGSVVEWVRLRRDESQPVVVLARREVLRQGNGVEYPPRLEAPLPRGAEVRRIGERAGWLHVQLPGGAAGWLPREVVVGD